MHLSFNKFLFILCLALFSQRAQAQRMYLGLGIKIAPYYIGKTEKLYVLPSDISYDVDVVEKDQSRFTLSLPGIHTVVGLEYRRWRFTAEPGIQPLNFAYKTYYPTGNGLNRSVTSGNIEDSYTSIVGFELPVIVQYALWNSRVKDKTIYLQGGSSYFQNFSPERRRNITYQKTYTWAVGGIAVQYGGLYRSNLSVRYNYLLNVSNVASMDLAYFTFCWSANLPSIKVQKRKLYSDE